MTCTFQSFDKVERFQDLVESVQSCDLCERLCDRRKVMSGRNGSLDSRVLFVAEAPGRLGADRTGIPLYGDRTGNNFENLLGNIGWRREEIFITNAVLCNPKQENGNNGTPTQEEIANCSSYLEMVVSLISPDVVVSLGATALSALGLLSPHGVGLRDGVAESVPWKGTLLFPLYHPGPRATVHRSLIKQRSDFMVLSKLVHPVKGLAPRKKASGGASKVDLEHSSPMQHIAKALLELGGRMTYFKLTKLMYFVDLIALERLGQTVASDLYLRQQEGPWAPKLDAALKPMHGHEILRSFLRGMPVVSLGPSPRFEVRLDDSILDIVRQVYASYGSMSNAQIKVAAYRSAPMRFVLEEERSGKKMLNKPVLNRGKTARDLIEDKP